MLKYMCGEAPGTVRTVVGTWSVAARLKALGFRRWGDVKSVTWRST